MPAEPLLSVLTPSHNRRESLLRKLVSLREQELQPGLFEWVVSFDRDSDGSQQALEEELNRRPPAFRVVLTTNPGRPGAAAARNHAATLAQGRLLLFSDDDVLLPPGCLAAHLAEHRDAAAAVVSGDLRLPAERRTGVGREPFEQPGGRGRDGLWINITGANTSLPAETFHAVGGYDESFSAYGGEDSDLGLRLRRHGSRIIRSAAAWAYHDGSVLADVDKAFSAGRAGVRVWRKHGDLEPALMLGVHPLLIQVKRAAMLPPFRWLMRPAVRAYEEAYLRGALAELRENRET